MNDFTAFKNQIFLYSVIVSLIIELISLPILGWDKEFLYGLLLGTAVAIVNFNILAFSFRKVINDRRGSWAFISYLIRLLIYGFAFYTAAKISFVSGMGSVLGFLTIKAAIIFIHGIKAKFDTKRKVSPEVRAAYERMDKANAEHKTDRVRDKIRRELSWQEEYWDSWDDCDEDRHFEEHDMDADGKIESTGSSLANSNRNYKRLKHNLKKRTYRIHRYK